LNFCEVTLQLCFFHISNSSSPGKLVSICWVGK
jgi:hypothetical protein